MSAYVVRRRTVVLRRWSAKVIRIVAMWYELLQPRLSDIIPMFNHPPPNEKTFQNYKTQ